MEQVTTALLNTLIATAIFFTILCGAYWLICFERVIKAVTGVREALYYVGHQLKEMEEMIGLLEEHK